VVLVAWSQYFRAVITVLLVAKYLMFRWFRAKNCRKFILFHSTVQIIRRSLCGSSILRSFNTDLKTLPVFIVTFGTSCVITSNLAWGLK
jgi:hypothetical protein